MSYAMEELLTQMGPWVEETFGPGSVSEFAPSLLAHLRKELLEVEADPTDPVEWADVVLLALHGLSRSGLAPEEICAVLWDKFRINQERQWPSPSSTPSVHAIEHQREVVDPSPAVCVWCGDEIPPRQLANDRTSSDEEVYVHLLCQRLARKFRLGSPVTLVLCYPPLLMWLANQATMAVDWRISPWSLSQIPGAEIGVKYPRQWTRLLALVEPVIFRRAVCLSVGGSPCGNPVIGVDRQRQFVCAQHQEPEEETSCPKL